TRPAAGWSRDRRGRAGCRRAAGPWGRKDDGTGKRFKRPVWRSSRSLPVVALLVAETAQRVLVVRPGVAHLAPQLEEDLAFELRFDRQARGLPDRAHTAAAGADDDGLLAVAFDEDRGRNAQHPAFIDETLDHHRGR